MAGVLEGRADTDTPFQAARFFANLADEPSVARLRTCLGHLPRPGDDQSGPLSTKVGSAASVRRVAVEALAKRKDPASFGPILWMLEADPSIRVRTAAAAALGEYADGKAVVPLVRALGQQDEGFGAQGHPDGEFRPRSSGRSGDGRRSWPRVRRTTAGPAKSQCQVLLRPNQSTWPRSSGCTTPGRLIEPRRGLIEPARGGAGNDVMDDQAKAEAGFAACVIDPARFGPAADHGKGGHVARRGSPPTQGSPG